MEDKEVGEGKIFAVVSYWFILCILPFLLRRDNKFAIFHAKQALVLFIFFVAGFIFSIIPFLGWAMRLVLFVYLILSLLGTVRALQGKYSRIPLIADIADKIIF